MKKKAVTFLALMLLFAISGCSGNEKDTIHTREEYLKDIYSEFTEPYIVDRIKYRITPDNTGEIMRYEPHRQQSQFGCHLPGGSRCHIVCFTAGRSEERRVGKECRSRWSPYH